MPFCPVPHRPSDQIWLAVGAAVGAVVTYCAVGKPKELPREYISAQAKPCVLNPTQVVGPSGLFFKTSTMQVAARPSNFGTPRSVAGVGGGAVAGVAAGAAGVACCCCRSAANFSVYTLGRADRRARRQRRNQNGWDQRGGFRLIRAPFEQTFQCSNASMLTHPVRFSGACADERAG